MNKLSQFQINLVCNLVSQGGILCLQLWYTRFLYNALGPELFGLVPLTTAFVLYLGLVTGSVSTAIRRHLTVAIASNDLSRAREILGVSFKSILILLLPVAAIGAVIVWQLPRIVQIPLGNEGATRYLAVCVIASFAIGQLTIPFGAATFAINRLDVRANIALMETVIRVAGVALLFQASYINLYSVATALIASAGFSTVLTAVMQHRLIPGVAPRLDSKWDQSVFFDMVTTGGWITLNMIGGILLLGIDLLVINRIVGPTEAGQYAPLLQIVSGFRSIGGMLGSLFSPTLMALYAKNDIQSLIAYTRKSARFMGVFLALPTGLICGFSSQVLALWLGIDYSSRWPYMVILVGFLTINLAAQPLFEVQIAANRVKIPAIATLLTGIINVVLAIVACKMYGSLGVAVAGSVAITAKNVLFTPLYNAKILGISYRSAYSGLFTSLHAFTCVCLPALMIASVLRPDNLFELCGCLILAAAIAIAWIYLVILNEMERREISDIVARFY